MGFTCEVSYKRIQKRKRKKNKKEKGNNAKRQGVHAEILSSVARLVFGSGSFILHCLHGARESVSILPLTTLIQDSPPACPKSETVW